MQSKSIRHIAKHKLYSNSNLNKKRRKKKENKRGKKDLLDGDGEGQPSREFGGLDDLLGDEPPAPADAGAGDDTLPRRPSYLRRLDSDEHFPQQLLRHVGPAALAHPVRHRRRRRLLNHHLLRPRRRHPHVLYYTPYRHLSLSLSINTPISINAYIYIFSFDLSSTTTSTSLYMNIYIYIYCLCDIQIYIYAIVSRGDWKNGYRERERMDVWSDNVWVCF